MIICISEFCIRPLFCFCYYLKFFLCFFNMRLSFSFLAVSCFSFRSFISYSFIFLYLFYLSSFSNFFLFLPWNLIASVFIAVTITLVLSYQLIIIMNVNVKLPLIKDWITWYFGSINTHASGTSITKFALSMYLCIYL